jgi:hypothetical protein
MADQADRRVEDIDPIVDVHTSIFRRKMVIERKNFPYFCKTKNELPTNPPKCGLSKYDYLEIPLGS